MAEFDPNKFLSQPFSPDEFLKTTSPTAASTEAGFLENTWGIAKQIPLGMARGVGNMLAAGAPAGMGEAIAANPQLYDMLQQRGEQIPTPEDYAAEKDKMLENIGINSSGNMPQTLPQRMASAAGESIPWSAAMGPVGMGANVGLGMVGGATGEFAKDQFGGDTQGGKATASIIGNLIGTFGAAGALGIAKGIYNMFGAPLRRLPGEFDLPATRGMLMDEADPARLRTLTEEQSMSQGARGPLARRVMDQARNVRDREVEATRYHDFLRNESEINTPLAAGENVAGTLRAEGRALETAGNEIYDAARASNPSRVIAEQNLAIPTVDRVLRQNGIANVDQLASYPSAARARTIIENMQERMRNLPNQTSPRNYEAQFNDMWQALKDVRHIRPQNRADAEILGTVRDSYHQWMRDTLDNVIFSGDREIIDNIAQADSIWRRLRRMTEVDTRNPARDYTRLTSAIFRDARTPDQVAQYITNLSSVDGASKAARMAGFLRDTFGTNHEVWDSIRQAVLHKALLADRPEQTGLQLANSIRNFTDGKGAALARELFPEGVDRLREFGQSLRRTNPPLANPSGSGYEAQRGIWNMVLSSVGLAEVLSGAHLAPTKWMLAGGIPIVMMLNNARKAQHATRETMQGPGMMGRLPIGAVGAMNELSSEGVP